MKIFGILCFISLWFYNNLAWSKSFDILNSISPLDKAEAALEKINVHFLNPLRDINLNLSDYTELLAAFNEFSKFDLEFSKSLLEKIKNHDTLTGTELFLLRRTITTYYMITKKILDFAQVYEFNNIKMSKALATDESNMTLVKSYFIWLSGNLIVIDHLEEMHNILYESDAEFRRIVKNALLNKSESIKGSQKTLNDLIEMSKNSVEVAESSKFRDQINLVKFIHDDLKAILANEKEASDLLELIISNKTSTEIIQGKNKFKLRNFSIEDFFVQTVDEMTAWFSQAFGNTAGAIHWRSGRLYKNDEALNIAKSKLKPMDIIIERSPFVLTDKFIPGHYGHVAIYLGTKSQLESINMWNHPSILPYHEEIASGHVILEAVRSGVHLNSLENFLNIDELTIIRKTDEIDNLNQQLLTEQITRGMDQIGKAYDFNFDISTLDKIVCSELVYIFYGNVHWPTKYRAGRPTITPDDIAEILFLRNTKFQFINFMIGKKNKKIDFAELGYLADELNYELRNIDGNPVENAEDPTNSYWKKETKCFIVVNNIDADKSDDHFGKTRRMCKTSYKEFYYEEKESFSR